MSKDKVLQQKEVLEKYEGKLCLIQSQYYPEGQGSLYVHIYRGVYVGNHLDAESRVEYDIAQKNLAHLRHPEVGDRDWHSGWGSGSGDGSSWPVRLGDTIFVLGEVNDVDDLENRLSKLPKKPKQLTTEDLKSQFPKVIQIWPTNAK